MTTRLDRLVKGLAASPVDQSLDHLDFEVGRAVASRVARARIAAAMAPVQIGAIGIALTIGVTAGTLTAAPYAAQPGHLFDAATRLAPSTLLDGGR